MASSGTKKVCLAMTVAGPGRVCVSAKLNGGAVIYLCTCTL